MSEKKINKKYLANIISEKYDLTKGKSVELVDTLFESIAEALSDGNVVEINGFGKFEVKTRAPRTGINPQTKEIIDIPPTNTPGFKASKNLKERVR